MTAKCEADSQCEYICRRPADQGVGRVGNRNQPFTTIIPILTAIGASLRTFYTIVCTVQCLTSGPIQKLEYAVKKANICEIYLEGRSQTRNYESIEHNILWKGCLLVKERYIR